MHNIEFSELALEKALEFAKEPQNQGQALRVYLDGKGCDGFYYGVSFDKPSEEDLIRDHHNLSIIIDPESYKFCEGSKVEWIDDERGKGFLVNNPKQRNYRGKFYKRKAWQKALES